MRIINTIKTIDLEKDEEYQTMLNEWAENYTSAFVTKMYQDGIGKNVPIETIQKYLCDPDNHIKAIENLAYYYYISNGEVFQLFDLAKSLPSLNYKITHVEIPEKNHEKNVSLITRTLKKIKHQQLTRDIISQTISTGTLTGIWLGDKKKPYLYLFDRVDKAFPSYMIHGEWVVQIDLSWLIEMNDNERNVFIKNLMPYIKQSDYDKYKQSLDDNHRYVDLPQDRTIVLKTHYLKRNQSFGTSWVTTGLYDLLHKNKLKDLEKTIANKIIKAVAVLTIGNPDDEANKYQKIPKPLTKKIQKGVKAGLDLAANKNGVSFISIPEFAKLEFPKVADTDTLNPEKFTSINNDVESAYGISSTVTRGSGGNYTSGKLSLDIQYKKLGVLLSDIETEVYGKLLAWILPTSVADNYDIVYDKEQPLTLKEKADLLMKLHSQSGFSLKAVVDCIGGIDFEKYVEQSIYEHKVLKLPDRIKPYTSAFIGVSEETKPEVDIPENENTEKTKTYGSNENPEVN